MLSISKIVTDFKTARSLPHVEVCLMRSATLDNDPFYAKMVDGFYKDAMRRHPRFPLIRFLQYGMALTEMPKSLDAHLAGIEASARRNVKKAMRNGYEFSRINYNGRLKDIADIHRSAVVRQGRPMPGDMLQEEMPPVNDPPSRDARHDYIYFGIIKDGKLCAYSGCMVAGELIAIGSLFGHQEHMSDGVVPLLLVNIVGYCLQRHPAVRYFMYDKYFGAQDPLRRFKRKFNFNPHKVTWVLG